MENNDSIFSEIKPAETEVTLLQGLLTRLIDFAIDIFVLFLIYKIIPRDVFLNLIRGYFIILFIIIISAASMYRFIFLVFFNKTIGMMASGVKLLNGELQPLSTKEKLLSTVRTRFSRIKYYKDK